MKRVNLLPLWYLQRRQRREALFRRVVLLGCLAISGVLALLQFRAATVAKALALDAQDKADEKPLVANLDASIAAQKSRIAHLENIQTAFRDVGNTVPMSAVLQQIQNYMTPGMALSHTHVEVRSEAEKTSTTPGPDGAAAKPRLHDVAHLTVVGIAPNDVLIAQLIGKLAANALFSDISLNYTRTEIIRDYSVRRFEIQMSLELDRLASEQPVQTARANLALPKEP